METVPNRREFATAITAELALVGLDITSTPAPAQIALADMKRFRDALQTIVRVRFGKHLSDEQMSEVMDELFKGIAHTQQLNKVSLKNSDDPLAGFRADL